MTLGINLENKTIEELEHYKYVIESKIKEKETEQNMHSEIKMFNKREECNNEESVHYYDVDGFVVYRITNLEFSTIKIPFEFFHNEMKNFITIKTNRLDIHTIVNGKKYEGTSIDFFCELKKLGNKYLLGLYNAVWKNVPVSHYKFLLPNIIDDFHIEIVESIKRYSKKIERKE